MTDTPPKTKSSRWLKIGLGVSLCLNLLVLGAIGGAIMRGGGPAGERARMGMQDPLQTVFRALPKETKTRLRTELRESDLVKPESRNAWLASVLDILRSGESFDDAAFGAALERRATTMGKITDQGRKVLREEIAAMSSEERAAFADRLEKRWNRKKKWRKKDHN